MNTPLSSLESLWSLTTWYFSIAESPVLAWLLPRVCSCCSPPTSRQHSWMKCQQDHKGFCDIHWTLAGEGNGNPLQWSCLENPRDGGDWWAAVYGVAQSRTRLKWLSSSSSLTLAEKLMHSFPYHMAEYEQPIIPSLSLLPLFTSPLACSEKCRVCMLSRHPGEEWNVYPADFGQSYTLCFTSHFLSSGLPCFEIEMKHAPPLFFSSTE